MQREDGGASVAGEIADGRDDERDRACESAEGSWRAGDSFPCAWRGRSARPDDLPASAPGGRVDGNGGSGKSKW